MPDYFTVIPDAIFAHLIKVGDNLVPPLVIVGIIGAVSFFTNIIGVPLVSNSLDRTTISIMFLWNLTIPLIGWGILSGLVPDFFFIIRKRIHICNTSKY